MNFKHKKFGQDLNLNYKIYEYECWPRPKPYPQDPRMPKFG
jgi:hypothetical protein